MGAPASLPAKLLSFKNARIAAKDAGAPRGHHLPLRFLSKEAGFQAGIEVHYRMGGGVGANIRQVMPSVLALPE